MSQDELFELTKLVGRGLHRLGDLRFIVTGAKRSLQEREVQARCVKPTTNLVRDHANTGTAALSRMTRLA